MAATVVADIGGTSSRWGILGEGNDSRILDGLPGFNPAVGDPEAFVRGVGERFSTEGIEVGDLFVYGAGCGTFERARRMAEALLLIWPKARMDVSSDLMGAAQGLRGDHPGLILILGTGMNAGWYDGTALHQPMPSLGYILGDEGSGADIGKHLLRSTLRGLLPPELKAALFPTGLDLAEVVEQLYRGPAPQAWLAAFTGRLAPNIDHPWAQDLVRARFKELARLLSAHFSEQERREITATGSVAHGLSGLLREALADEGMQLSDVQPSPLPGLLRFRSAPPR